MITLIRVSASSIGVPLVIKTYLVEEFSKSLTFGWIDRFHEGYATVEMCTKVAARFAVLAFRSMVNAVVEDSFEAIEVSTDNIQALVGNKTC